MGARVRPSLTFFESMRQRIIVYLMHPVCSHLASPDVTFRREHCVCGKKSGKLQNTVARVQLD